MPAGVERGLALGGADAGEALLDQPHRDAIAHPAMVAPAGHGVRAAGRDARSARAARAPLPLPRAATRAISSGCMRKLSPPSSSRQAHVDDAIAKPRRAELRRIGPVLHRRRRSSGGIRARSACRRDPRRRPRSSRRCRCAAASRRNLRDRAGSRARSDASVRSIPNVGRLGSVASKKWTGKLLQMPPSENQTFSDTSIHSPGRSRIGIATDAIERHRRQQQRKREAHAHRHDDRQVFHRAELDTCR